MHSGPAASVSRGTFVYRGSKKKIDAGQYIKPTHVLDSVEECKERMELFKEISLNVQWQADQLQEEINNQVFNDLISYLNEVHKRFDPLTEDADGGQQGTAQKRRKISTEIPAAALIMGVNTPDHEGMFSDLIAMVKKRVSPHVALVKSVKCPNVKSIIAETVSQLTGTGADDVDNENEDSIGTSNVTGRRIIPTMKHIVDWFNSLYGASPPHSDKTGDIEFVCLGPSKTPVSSPLGVPADVLSPRKLSVCLKRISLLSLQKVEQGPKVDSPPTSPLTSPTKRLTRMSLMSPVKRAHEDPISPPRDPESRPGGLASPVRKRTLKLKLARVKPRFKPLVVILEDFEGFPAAALQDYVTILSHHRERLPVVLVFGIATTISSVHRLLPRSVSSHLSIHKFQSMMSSAHLTKLLDKILLDPNHPFKLDSRVFNFLLDNFLFNDFSVRNFIRSFKLSMMEHFQGNPASILCTDIEKVKPTLRKLSNKKLDGIRTLQSFRRYVESRQPEEQVALLDESKYTKKIMMRMMIALHVYHRNFFPIFRCLHALSSKLPQFPLGKTPRELYGYCLQSPVYESEEYSQALLLMRNFSKSDLLDNLSQVDQILASVEQRSDELEGVKSRLKELSLVLKNFDEQAVNSEANEEDASIDAMLGQRLDMSSLRRILRSSEDRKKVSPDHSLRQEIVDYLDEVFRKFLDHPRSLPLHEVVYFSGVEFLRSRVLPSPRSSLQRALNDPYCYLQNDRLLVNRGQITSDLPDVCIAYKLHLECGKLINLFDWLQAFATIVEPDDVDEVEDGRKPIDRTVQARFVRAVSELQFLGFVKPTRRKTDHVARLTWGSC